MGSVYVHRNVSNKIAGFLFKRSSKWDILCDILCHTLRHSKNATSSSMKSERLFLPGFCCSAETRTVSHVTGYAVYYFFDVDFSSKKFWTESTFTFLNS